MINLTQHKATPEQVKQGVIDTDSDIRKTLLELLTFDDISETFPESLRNRANQISEIANLDGVHASALIGGALYFMPYLVTALKEKNIKPFYSFTKRVIENEFSSDGSVKKTSVFKHVAFIEA